jgi:hypothetical protein
MKQTAVDWLIEKLEKHYVKVDIKNTTVFYQAKEKEKEQIIDSFGVGCQVESTRLIGYHKMAEQYYNETFKEIEKL